MSVGRRIVVALAIAFLGYAPLSAQSALPRAAILVQPEGESDSTMASLSSTIGATLQLSLSLVGEFQMLTLDPDKNGEPPQVAAEREADLIFAVSLRRQEGGGYELTSRVYNSLEDSLEPVATEEAESLFDVFDAADRLTVGLVQAVSEADVAFGGVRLINEGFAGDYEVRVDGVLAGETLSRIDRLPAGSRTLSIQPPGSSAGAPYVEREITVTEGETVTVTFALPFLPPETQELLDRSHAAVLATAFGMAQEESQAEGAGSGALGDNPLLREREEELIAALNEEPGRDETMAVTTPARYRSLLRSLDSAAPVPGRSFTASLKDNWILADSVPLQRQITVDGEIGDWAGIPPIRSDTTAEGDRAVDRGGGVTTSELSGTDFAELRLAESEEGLYFLLTFHDGAPQTRAIKYRLSFYAPNHESGNSRDLIEILWTYEGVGSASGRVTRAMTGDNPWQELSSRPARQATFENGFEGFFPRDLYERARDHAGMNGWEIGALTEIIRDGEYLATDEIRWNTEVYF